MNKHINLKRDEKGKQSIFKAVGVGFAVSVIISALMMVIFSAVTAKIDGGSFMIPVASIVTILLAGFSGGFVSAKMYGEAGLQCGALCAGVFICIIGILNTLFVREGIGALMAVKLPLILLSSIIGGIIGVNLKRKRK